jgi:hypothetical protein
LKNAACAGLPALSGMMNKGRRGKIDDKVTFNDNKVFCIAKRAKDICEQGLWLAKKYTSNFN